MSEAPAEQSGAADPRSRYGVVVVGAGQAGLAMGYHLSRRDRHFVILDRADTVGAAWRARWESLTLFTPRRYDALPGLPFPGDPDGYPGRDEVIDYLEAYGERFHLPFRLDCDVRRLTRGGAGFVLDADGATIEAENVVVATGPFQRPNVPEFATRLGQAVVQMHSTGYRNPRDIPVGTVLVVGGGNTGFQIAEELSATHRVVLSVGSRQTPLPQRFLGRDLFWWLTRSRLLDASVGSRLGRRLSTRETLIGSSPRRLRRRHGVAIRPRVVDTAGATASFADGSEIGVDVVIWATGYRPDHSWIELPVADAHGRVRHRRGVTDVPGLFFLGLTWQHTRGSALLGWVKDDAAYIAERIDDGGTSHDGRHA